MFADRIWPFVRRHLKELYFAAFGVVVGSILIAFVPDDPPKFPEHANILFLDATNDRRGAAVKEAFPKRFPDTVCYYHEDWAKRWVMDRSRIYYIDQDCQLPCRELGRAIPGEQDVIDIDRQDEQHFPERPADLPPGSMKGFDSERDVIFFIGRDHREILAWLRDGKSA